MTCFTNAEEEAVDLTESMPFLLESQLRELGAEFVGAGDFQNNVVVAGRLVTGQNPASASNAAKAIVALLGSSSSESCLFHLGLSHGHSVDTGEESREIECLRAFLDTPVFADKSHGGVFCFDTFKVAF